MNDTTNNIVLNDQYIVNKRTMLMRNRDCVTLATLNMYMKGSKAYFKKKKLFSM